MLTLMQADVDTYHITSSLFVKLANVLDRLVAISDEVVAKSFVGDLAEECVAVDGWLHGLTVADTATLHEHRHTLYDDASGILRKLSQKAPPMQLAPTMGTTVIPWVGRGQFFVMSGQ
jgi:hypothetical protein